MSEILHGSTVIQCPCCGESWNDDNYSYTAKLTELETRCRELQEELTKYKSGFKNEQHKFSVEFVKNEKLEAANQVLSAKLEKCVEQRDKAERASGDGSIMADLNEKIIAGYNEQLSAITIDSIKGGA